MVIGGTSAGMAVLGSIYFSAQNGTVTSATALANPYDSRVTVDSTDFFEVPFLENVITDTHYDGPDRKGRHVVFLARALQDWNIDGKGIACDEYTSVCIDENGIAHAYGEYPSFDDNAYFLQVNCENFDALPENCVINQALNWNLGGDAVKVYNLKGNLNGSNSFDLNTWETGNGGTWENWYVDNGTFNNTADSPIQCFPVSTYQFNQLNISITPNPVMDYFTISGVANIDELTILDINGRVLKSFWNVREAERLNISELANGVYFLKVKIGEKSGVLKLFK